MNLIDQTIDRITDEPSGGTAHIVGNDLPKTGYYVGGAGVGITFPPGVELDRFMLTQFMLRSTSEYIGWWTDGETRRLYVDQVTWVERYIDAEALCVERREIAFWDIEHGREWKPVLLP